MAIDGIVGERTEQPLSAESLWLFGDEATYILVVQYEQDDRETMLAAWQQVMADLRVPQPYSRPPASGPSGPRTHLEPAEYLPTAGDSQEELRLGGLVLLIGDVAGVPQARL